jgi:hypothetical protein
MIIFESISLEIRWAFLVSRLVNKNLLCFFDFPSGVGLAATDRHRPPRRSKLGTFLFEASEVQAKIAAAKLMGKAYAPISIPCSSVLSDVQYDRLRVRTGER